MKIYKIDEKLMKIVKNCGKLWSVSGPSSPALAFIIHHREHETSVRVPNPTIKYLIVNVQ
jgi:2-methylaconitate cis-trans-isomerase PrpF